MRSHPASPPSPRLFLAALLAIALPACPAIADAPSGLAAARAAMARTESLWRQAHGLDPSAAPALWGHAPAPSGRAAASDPDDVHWQARYGLPVPDRWVRALLPFGNQLIVGGAFERIGSLVAPGIAAWDGTHWSELPGFPGGNVIELAPYAGGFVAFGTGSYGPGVWHWDGAAWHALEDLPFGIQEGLDMAVLDDQIAISYLVNDGSGWHSRVALRGPGGWTQLGADFDNAAYGLAWYQGELYAGGWFRNVGNASIPLVARWDGVAWQPVGTGLPVESYSIVRDLGVAGGELIAAGTFSAPSSPDPIHAFARWNGTRWASLDDGAPANPNLTRLRTLGSDLYALGHFQNGAQIYGIARWDGAAWHVAEDSLQSFVYDIASFGGDLYAGGALANDGSRPATPLVRKRGGLWQPPIRPTTAAMHGLLGESGPFVTDIEIMDGQIYAAGRFQFAGGEGGWRRCAGAARWDGHEWAPLGMESWYDSYPAGLAVHQGSLYAVGSFILDVPGAYGSVARLAGQGWELVGNGSFQPFSNAYCIASAGGELMVGGDAQNDFHGIAAWDGAVWHPVGGGISEGYYISAIAGHGADVIAAGSFAAMDGTPCANIAAWNPATGWRALGAGLDRDVSDLLSRNGVLYAAGFFTSADGIPVDGLACWKDGRWSALPDLPGGTGWGYPVWTLGWFHDHLVASSDGIPGRIVILEADSTWHPLGSGLNWSAYGMVENGPSLFVAGGFSSAGGAPAYGVAEWRDESTMPAPSLPPVSAAPNPFATDVHLRYELSVPTRARVEIFDLAGHRVAVAFEGYQNAGPQDVVWRPGRAKAGVYFARLVIAGESRVVRVVRVQ